jgi:hypothetical protein
MFDDLDRLRESEPLRAVLAHYAEQGRDDREAWRDRLDRLDGVPPRELVRLHGELLAFGWVEQNTGVTPSAMPPGGGVPACYRVTAAGLRALRQVRLAAV